MSTPFQQLLDVTGVVLPVYMCAAPLKPILALKQELLLLERAENSEFVPDENTGKLKPLENERHKRRRDELRVKVINFKTLPFAAMFANCVGWLLYGLSLEIPPLWLPNIASGVLAAFYLLSFYQLQSALDLRKERGNLLTQGVMVVAFSIFCTALYGMGERLQKPLGNTCALVNTLMLSAPAESVMDGFRKKDVKLLGDLGSTIAGLVCSAFFLNLGYWIMELETVWVPNLLGVVVGLCNLICRAVYGDSVEKQPEEGKKKQ